jgi:hypothetical protein
MPRFPVKIIISGKDRTAELEPAIREQADRSRRHPEAVELPDHLSAMSLWGARDEDEFTSRYVRLSRVKQHTDTLRFHIPRKPGPGGAIMGLVRAFFWKLLRYQHDRMAFRQNIINTQFATALELQQDETESLRARLVALEKRLGMRDP